MVHQPRQQRVVRRDAPRDAVLEIQLIDAQAPLDLLHRILRVPVRLRVVRYSLLLGELLELFHFEAHAREAVLHQLQDGLLVVALKLQTGVSKPSHVVDQAAYGVAVLVAAFLPHRVGKHGLRERTLGHKDLHLNFVAVLELFAGEDLPTLRDEQVVERESRNFRLVRAASMLLASGARLHAERAPAPVGAVPRDAVLLQFFGRRLAGVR